MKTANLELPLSTAGTERLKQSFRKSMEILDTEVKLIKDGGQAYEHEAAEGVTTVKEALDFIIARLATIPVPIADDIGKVIKVVSDGDEGAEYSLEEDLTSA